MRKLTEEEELTRQTYNKLAIEWSTTHNIKTFWQEEMEQFNKFLPKGKILDVGSGAGRDARKLVDYGYDYIGTDYSDRLIEQARKSNPGLIFKEHSVYDLEFEKLFDGFWCAALLLHIPKKRIQEAMKAIRKNMKTGAVGFISTKEGNGEGIEARGGLKDYDRLIAYWQNEDFRNILTQEGFEILQEGKKPYEDSVWLTYIVRVIK
jgi:2-polyprenyl-3-methyl-5-hydroxy-6-metoxy-1,4-benzoquinol methylase